MIKNTKKK